MIESRGNIVLICGVSLPALNIQIDGYPKMMDQCPDIEGCPGHFVGVYFEVPFESGQHWVVDQQKTGEIEVAIYPNWQKGEYEKYEKKVFSSWVEFSYFANEAKRN